MLKQVNLESSPLLKESSNQLLAFETFQVLFFFGLPFLSSFRNWYSNPVSHFSPLPNWSYHPSKKVWKDTHPTSHTERRDVNNMVESNHTERKPQFSSKSFSTLLKLWNRGWKHVPEKFVGIVIHLFIHWITGHHSRQQKLSAGLEMLNHSVTLTKYKAYECMLTHRWLIYILCR